MIHGIQVSGKGTFYLKKPHFCPDCNSKLMPIKVSKVINSKSPEAKDYDFRMRRGVYASGNIKFIWKELKCPSCERQLTIDEMQKIEFDNLPYEQQEKINRRNNFLYWLFKIGIIAIMVLCVIYWISTR